MDSTPEGEWTLALRSVLAGTDKPVDEPYLHAVYSSRPCPHCAQFQLVRHPLPGRLKVLRRVGLNLRHYVCDGCREGSIIRCH